MHKKPAFLAVAAFVLSVLACLPALPVAAPPPSLVPQTAAIASEQVAAFQTGAPITLTATPLDSASATPEAQLTAPANGTDVTSPSLDTPTVTPSPTEPPPLPLRDDLDPMTLEDWPRPGDDNGLGIHFIASGYYDEKELD